jgi:hypothetical protein
MHRGPASVQSALIGMVAGLTEVACQQPLVAWKNALQQFRLPSLHPREMYRGGAANAAAVMPVTSIQFSSFAVLSSAGASPATAAAAAGCASVRLTVSSREGRYA